MNRNLVLKTVAVLLGGIFGYAYYHFIGCRTGTCPITSNPWISTGYGALFGFVLMLGKSKKKNDPEQEKN